MLKIFEEPDFSIWQNLAERPSQSTAAIEVSVRPIIDAIIKDGDEALRLFTEKFDGFFPQELQVTEKEFITAENRIASDLKEAILQAKSNIEKFHISQKEDKPAIETVEGVTCWRKSLPIEKVGLYIPSGTAPLFSTVLMLAIPANIAGCKEIVLCSPPDKSGNIHPAILYAAKCCGVTKIIKAGGAQAIAAMAFGTASIPKVDKIFGPGNQYVTVAKQLVQQMGVAIDMPAGPSEVLLVADNTAVPAFVAADLLSQAEHGADSQVILVAENISIVDAVISEINNQLRNLPRSALAIQALSHSKAFVFSDLLGTGMQFSNFYAPEHLILSVDHPEDYAERVVNAGSVFLGHYTPESAGDYASGTNHTLPTNGYARAYSGVSLDSFIKKITFQQISPTGLLTLGPVIEKMAEAEMLDAHKYAVTVRLNTL